MDSRKQSILRAIVIEYVEGAEPISSDALTQKYELGVRAATVRNEMAEMADMGLLEQPHTSAGRIPSDLGYRYFVDELFVARKPVPKTVQQVRKSTQEGDALQELLRDSTRLLSRLTRLLSVAATVNGRNVQVKTCLVSAIGPKQALLVVALSDGQVSNRMVEVPAGLSLEDLGYANELLASSLLHKNFRAATQAKPPKGPTPASETLVSTLWAHLRQIADDVNKGVVFVEGAEYMLAQPEFRRDEEGFRQVVEEVVDSKLLYQVLNSDGPTSVSIGRENKHAPLKRLTVIRRPFMVGQEDAGVIAIIGPTRMDYESSIPLLDFTADALSNALTKFFGN